MKDEIKYKKYLGVFIFTGLAVFLSLFLLTILGFNIALLGKLLIPLPLLVTGIFGLYSGYSASNEFGYIWLDNKSRFINYLAIFLGVAIAVINILFLN